MKIKVSWNQIAVIYCHLNFRGIILLQYKKAGHKLVSDLII